MRTSHSVKWILAGALILPGLTGCSSSGGEEESPEVAANDANGEANPDANNQGDANDNAEPIADGSAGADGMAGTDGTAGADSYVAGADATDPAANPMADAASGGNEIPSELLNSGSDPAATNPIPTAPEAPPEPMANAAATPAPAPMDPAGGFSAPPSDVRVYYVSSSSASLHSGPDANSGAVGSLKKGDPVLVKVEGNWANVINRGWVELASLSMSPVARAKSPKAWN